MNLGPMRSTLAAALLVLVALPAGAAPKKGPATPPVPAAGSGAPTAGSAAAPVAPATPATPAVVLVPTKTATACGTKLLPLVVGNSWTYGQVAAPLPAPDAIARIAPAEPKTIVVTVKSVDAKKGGDTTVTLEEKVTVDLSKDPKKPQLDERVVTSTIVCSATRFDISPESVFFAAEPGGIIGMTLTKVDRKGTDWKLAAGILGDAEWREDVSATWQRPATAGSEAPAASGKLELERVFTPGQGDLVITKAGSFKTERLFLKTTGRVTLDGAPADLKPMELPDNWVNTIWLADGIGAVQLLNSYAHMYQLVDAKLN